MKFFLKPLSENTILHNRGCGINYVQRRKKVPFDTVDPQSWFLKERLCDKIAIDISWSQLEPEEGHFLWDDPEWEGCFRSWIDAGFKILLKVRGMDTLGTLYNQGTPQWVFDAGAKYVDEPISFYRNCWMLNEIPGDKDLPIRYPVYWDDIYIEKAGNLIRELGRRYNGKSFVENVAIAHTGRWGEMHLADHYSRENWDKNGYTLKNYIAGHKALIDLYREAFPDTPLQQSLGSPSFQDTLKDAAPCFEYLAKYGISFKFGGLGKSWHPPFQSPWLDDDCCDLLKKYVYQSKVVFENLVLPEAMDLAYELKMSCWQRGGEAPGLGEENIARDLPKKQKKIYSFYSFYPEQYDKLTIEDEKNIWRTAARRTGYRLWAESLEWNRRGNLLDTEFVWRNDGCAPCYEDFEVVLCLLDANGIPVWKSAQKPQTPCGARNWDANQKISDRLTWELPQNLPENLTPAFGLRHRKFAGEMFELANANRRPDGLYHV